MVLQQTEPEAASADASGGVANVTSNGTTSVPPPPNSLALAVMSEQSKSQAKRLHVSNIPFRFRDPDLRAMFGVSLRDTMSCLASNCIERIDPFIKMK